MRTFKKLVISILLLPLIVSCSTVFGTDQQPVSIKTYDLEGNHVEGASCTLSNDEGNFYVTTPGTVVIKQACGNAELMCTKKGYERASAAEIEKSHKAGTWVNILWWPGYFVDRISGSACKYPSETVFYFKKIGWTGS